MLKYGNVSNINNITSKTLIPRNLTYQKSSNNNNNNIINNVITNNNLTSISVDNASITDLTVQTINVIGNTVTPNIVISSPIAYSHLKSDYFFNNFNLYPFFISVDAFIKNKNLKLDTENLTIKDNIFIINSNSNNISITNNQYDDPISGFIFPIGDRNSDTDYYSGLLYLPNSQIEKISSNSTIYKWSGVIYKYFSNTNKGFFKFKYISQNLTLALYQNNLDSNYVDLINNTNNLTNVLVGGLACGDGEIVSINNSFLTFKISDGINDPYNTITITKNNIEIFNNLAIVFQNNLQFNSLTNNYIKIDDINKLIHFYNNILLDMSIFQISIKNILNFTSNDNILIQVTNTKIQFNVKTYITDISILNSFELNNIPFNFINTLSIVSNNITFMYFDAINNDIVINVPTVFNKLQINGTLELLNNSPIIFSNNLIFNDSNGNNFANFDSLLNNINFIFPTLINNLTINTRFNLNNIPISVNNNFIVQDNLKNIFVTFNSTNNIFFNNLYFNKLNPFIIFDYNQIFTIQDTDKITTITVDNGLNIIGPNNGSYSSTNTSVNSSITTTNSIINYGFNIYTPINKLYIVSGITNLTNNNIVLTCNSVCNNNLLSGTIIGTTRCEGNSNICMFNINIWTCVSINNSNSLFTLNYNSLLPINTNNIGDWSINNITIESINDIYNININCSGSLIETSNIIWGFKIDILSI